MGSGETQQVLFSYRSKFLRMQNNSLLLKYVQAIHERIQTIIA